MLIDLLKEQTVERTGRGYIGASLIAHSCDRYIWLEKEGIVKTTLSFKQQRIFERGHWEEARILNSLNLLKDFIIDHLQYELRNDYIQGHVDGILKDKEGKRYILEIKTMKQENYRKLLKNGVFDVSPTYWGQCQTYMRLSGIDTTILIVVNKNTEEMHEEIILANPVAGDDYLNKAKRLSERKEMPIGLLGCPTKQKECFGCSYESFCFATPPGDSVEALK